MRPNMELLLSFAVEKDCQCTLFSMDTMNHYCTTVDFTCCLVYLKKRPPALLQGLARILVLNKCR